VILKGVNERIRVHGDYGLYFGDCPITPEQREEIVREVVASDGLLDLLSRHHVSAVAVTRVDDGWRVCNSWTSGARQSGSKGYFEGSSLRDALEVGFNAHGWSK